MRILFALFFLLAWPSGVPGQEVLTWEDCVREAAQNNPDLAAAQASVQQARFQYQGSYSNFFPHLSLDAGYTKAKSPTSLSLSDAGSDTSDEFSMGLTLSQSLFSGFHDKAGVDRTRAEL